MRRQSILRPPCAAIPRRDGIGFTGSRSRASMRLASAISAVDICSKSSVLSRSSAEMVKELSISSLVPSSSPSGWGSSGIWSPSSACAARFSADCASFSSCTPRTAGSIIDIMCSR